MTQYEFVVELQDGCWLADWEGDPGRTLRLGNAKLFRSEQDAAFALEETRRNFPRRGYRDAKIYKAREREHQG